MKHMRPHYSRLRLCSLQNQNHHLDVSLAEAVIQLDQLQIVACPNQENLIKQLAQSQRQVRAFFGEELIKAQIQGQRGEEKKQLIARYEKRVQDLRTILIHKEVDLNFVHDEQIRETLKKGKLQKINTISYEQTTIVNKVREKKLLEVEISALKHTLASVDTGSTIRSQTSQSEGNMKELWGLDGILGKTAKVLQAEEQRHIALLSEVKVLQKELQQLEDLRKELKEEYLNQGEQNKHPPINNMKILPKQLSGVQSPTKLTRIEINILSPPGKPKAKVLTLREHKSKRSKEN